jgi:flagellar biosynthesis anti-sigma factor FlgM
MKIDVNILTVSMLPVDMSTQKVSSGSVPSTQNLAQDRTTFHSDTLSVQSLTSQAMTSPEVRQGKVDDLRQSVKSGDYHVDASKTADAIVNSKDV